jgi:gamma-glutamyltranspeptidase/glutathione hydrolase
MKNAFLPTFLLILIPFLGQSQDRGTGKTFATRSEVMGVKGMIASSNPLVAQVGLSILQKGGNAIDAAIAANALQGVVDPSANGIGGDLFVMIWDAKSRKLYGLNSSGRSPELLTLPYFKAKEMTAIPRQGPLSVSVPGCVEGWFEMNKRFGKMKMEALLTPAINYARDGFPISDEAALVLNFFKPDALPASNFKKLFFPGSRVMGKGELFKNPDLANSLSLISKKGRDGFYTGELAKKIEAHIRKEGGFLSAADLASHQSEWVEPVSTNYRGYDVWELPPNGQGIAVLQMLNILEGYPMKDFGYGSPEHIHHFVEAKRLAFEDMAVYYGDPAFHAIPVQKLISKAYAAERRKLIDSSKVGTYEAGPVNESNTIYLTVADAEGNVVSLIQSNFGPFGSMEVAEGTGFCLQNRGGSFVLDASHINGYAPKKRPFHTIIPSFITKEGKPFISFGVMGGDMQAQGHVQIVMNIIDFAMNLQEAGDAPRIRHSGTLPVAGRKNPGSIQLESGFAYETIRRLMNIGHQVGYAPFLSYGGYQAIMIKDGIYIGASDGRMDGCALGY